MTGSDDLREFLIVLRRALLLVCHWIAKKYDISEDT